MQKTAQTGVFFAKMAASVVNEPITEALARK